jgi:fatty-acyl-CoA synthase
LDEAYLQAHCRAQIAGYKVPRAIMLADDLPKTASAKVAKQTVREVLAERFGKDGPAVDVQAAY